MDNKNKGIEKREAQGNVILLEPNSRYSSEYAAKAIAACKGVKEVMMTSGHYGFIAITEETGDGAMMRITDSLRKFVKKNGIHLITSHHVYASRHVIKKGI